MAPAMVFDDDNLSIITGVRAIEVNDDEWSGAADPGRDGMALEV